MIVSENVQALPWHRAGFATDRILVSLSNSGGASFLQTARYTNGMVWHYEDLKYGDSRFNPHWNRSALFTANRKDQDPAKPPIRPTMPVPPLGVANSFHKINGGGATVSDSIFNKTLDPYNMHDLARPSSAHVDGVNCGFGDGATRFVVKSINYRVYQAMMTPHGKASLVPYPEFVLTDELGD